MPGKKFCLFQFNDLKKKKKPLKASRIKSKVIRNLFENIILEEKKLIKLAV